MKIIICTIPIRPAPTDYPPFGSLAVIQALRSAGYDPIFFDIDGLRPAFTEALEYFRREAPDILGISAVHSTGYGYVKKLCKAIRAVLPEVKIVLGGNLAASAELLHRFCDVDVCVIGEGEKVIVNLVNYYASHLDQVNYSELRRIRGITYLNPGGDVVFTGYEVAIPAGELFDPDFSILEKYSDIGHFTADPLTRLDFAQDPRSYESCRAGKKMGTVVSTKGCVGRCTFCHRWDKGFRQISPEKVIGRVQYLMDRYNVGFIQFSDENFGSDRKATDELIHLIKPLDILWYVGGVRARSIDLDLLKRMHDAGCVAVYYGFETGSQDILEVMEKKLELSHNLNAAKWTYEAGIFTGYQLVLGMPGETPRTISETIEMVKQITEFLPEPPYKYLSPNYVQALPGTPVYECARAKGLIGPTLEDEEAYLLAVSDVDAAVDTKFLNFTQYPYLIVRSWKRKIVYEATIHWARARRRQNPLPSLPQSAQDFKSYKKWCHVSLRQVEVHPDVLVALAPIRWFLMWLWTLGSAFRHSSNRVFCKWVWELVAWRFKRRESFKDYRSLRRIMKDVAQKPKTQTEESTAPLRLGR